MKAVSFALLLLSVSPQPSGKVGKDYRILITVFEIIHPFGLTFDLSHRLTLSGACQIDVCTTRSRVVCSRNLLVLGAEGTPTWPCFTLRYRLSGYCLSGYCSRH